jgi:hypothetical protein
MKRRKTNQRKKKKMPSFSILALLLVFVFTLAEFPVPFYTQTVYVQKVSGSTVPDGSLDRPFTSVIDAMNSIADASPTKRYVVSIGPGTYTEAGPLHVKANVFIKGVSKLAVRLNLNWDLDDPSWNNPSGSTDDRTGFESVSLVGTENLANFSTQQSGAGKLYLLDVRVNNPLTVATFSPISQLVLQDSQFFANVTIIGMNSEFNGAYFVNDNYVNFLSSPASLTLLEALGGATDGGVTVSFTNGDQNMNLLLLNFAIFGSLLVDGTGAAVTTNTAALPPPANVIVTNGATLTPYN